MKHYGLTLALLLSGIASGVSAQNVIEEGVATVLEKNVVYEFTPSMSGTLTVTVTAPPYFAWIGNGSFIYWDEECSPNKLVQKASYSTSEDQSYTDYIFKPMEDGITYYVKQNYYGDNVNFTFEMSESSTSEVITKVVPSTELAFNYVQNPEICIYASASISSFGKATISYGDITMELDPYRFGVAANGSSTSRWLQIGGSSYADFKALMYDIAATGAKEFTVTVEDVEAGGLPVNSSDVDEKGVKAEDGTISVTYPIEPSPVYLPSESEWPSKFYSYWEPGDPSAVITLAFNMDIKSVGEAKVIMGSVAPGVIGSETYDEYPLTEYIKIEGNLVKIDLAGVERIGNKNTVTINVSNVVGENGMPVEMNEYGTTLTLFHQMSYSKEEAPSGVETIESVNEEGKIYNLKGIKLDKSGLKSGLYIIDGKKVMIK